MSNLCFQRSDLRFPAKNGRWHYENRPAKNGRIPDLHVSAKNGRVFYSGHGRARVD